MKQMEKIRNILRMSHILLTFISLVCLYSCNDNEQLYDVYGDKGAIYVNELTGSSVSLASGYVLSTPSGSLGKVQVKFPVRSTMPVKEDIEVRFKVNNDLVQTYNEKYNTEYKTLDLEYLALLNTAVHITKGDLESRDSVSIYLPEEKFQSVESGDYLLPVEVDTVIGYLPLTKLKEKTIYYLSFNVFYNPHNVRPIGSEGDAGTLVTDRTSWTISYTGEINYGELTDLIAGDDLVGPSAYTGGIWNMDVDYFTIDLGKVHSDILGVYVLYSKTSWEWKSVKVSTSLNNENWDVQGNTTVKSSGDNRDDKGIAKFVFPVAARYIKIEPFEGIIKGGKKWFVKQISIYE